MLKQEVGVVGELWRYPVKSMLGEKVAELAFGAGGAEGDRLYALRNQATGHVLSAKKWAALLNFHASFDGRVKITTPDGRALSANDPSVSEKISAVLGHGVRLEHVRGAKRERAEIDPANVFGDVPVEKVIPGLTAQTMPDTFGLPHGTFFDSATLHLLASGSLAHLRSLQGGSAIVDARRFRPNIYIHSASGWDGFVEDAWLGGTLAIGDLRIHDLKAALRCVMTTHAQSELPRDLSILRTAAQHHQATLGVFAAVKQPGIARVGDPVYLLK